jgi:hypothetical protein
VRQQRVAASGLQVGACLIEPRLDAARRQFGEVGERVAGVPRDFGRLLLIQHDTGQQHAQRSDGEDQVGA